MLASPSFLESLNSVGLSLKISDVSGYGLFTNRDIQKGFFILTVFDENMLSMNEFLRQVQTLKRHPHEFLANMFHKQSETLDYENSHVKWFDLLSVKSPVLFLNGANSPYTVNVRLEIMAGWAFREVSVLCATTYIPSGSELLDSYML